MERFKKVFIDTSIVLLGSLVATIVVDKGIILFKKAKEKLEEMKNDNDNEEYETGTF